ncbi:glycosyltransferase family 1 protein [Leptolyngbya sp. FACHB-671]|uniref:glycosyltransferase n=1 Tax=Leptolyngbya sp. FACHB-671 TaxID=2692812 RepID=UPI001689A7D1|nr:glycosyltransferase [Leptolyngbya sp. FACHB-671]MBD2067797.1 glycosyltransferase family 1 protein [Leptolyngbya sp. FACHB-671]
MKVLIASTAALGHLNPLLAVAKILIKHNHEVVVQTAPELRSMVEAAGVPFTPEPQETSNFTDAMALYLELKQAKNPNPGLEMAAFDIEYFFAKKIGGQAAGLKQALQDFPADVILTDATFFGTLPMLLGSREERPTIVHLGISLLNLFSAKNSPPQLGMSEKEQLAERERRERVFHKPAQAGVDKALAELGCGPLPCSPLESMSVLPDLYLQHGIESFQYSDDSSSSSHVHYIGLLPMPPGQPALPTWWHELDRTKRLVLVTQGTLTNRNLGQLIGPTLTGLAKEEDVIVLATTGGQPIESILTEIPANAHVASFLPYELILPSVDLLLTNGGYGTVNLALAHGIPIVSAGMTEDKEEVSAHVQWAGVGIDLRTNQATAEDLRAAARKVLDNPVYSERAKELALEFASHNTEIEVLRLLEACVLEPSTV